MATHFSDTAFSGIKRQAATIHNQLQALTCTDDAHPEAMINVIKAARRNLNKLEDYVRRQGKIKELCGHCGRGECAIGEPCPVCGDVPEFSQLTPTS